MTILGLNNNFYGSYSSNQVFFSELTKAFSDIGATVITVDSMEAAIKVYESTPVDFSFGFSKYRYFHKNIPLYEKYGVFNYQWVSDNPLKMHLDTESRWVKYIFIDKEYPDVLDEPAKNGYLFLPLGFLDENVLNPGQKNGRILFPGKIRSLVQIQKQIDDSPFKALINTFLERYDLSESFIKGLAAFFKEKGVSNPAEKETIFRLANEYARVKKRIWVLNNLTGYPVDVIGEVHENQTNNPRIQFLPPVEYSNLANVMNAYSAVINVDPNYHDCVHDRFIKAVSSGTACVTNENKWTSLITPATFSFKDKSSVKRAVDCALADDFWEKQFNGIKRYSWAGSAKIILNDFNRRKVENAVPNKI